jgi:signal peptidase I
MSCALVGYASQVVFVSRGVSEADMAPALVPGESVIVDNTAFWARSPFRGEIVWLDSPDGRVFRRILALPGDTVSVTGGTATVNGIALAETYAHGTGPDFAPTIVEGGYFVLADDRGMPDGRTWGPIAGENIFGSAAFTRDGQGSFEAVRRPRMPDPLEPE